jgi:hypothetical protein
MIHEASSFRKCRPCPRAASAAGRPGRSEAIMREEDEMIFAPRVDR